MVLPGGLSRRAAVSAAAATLLRGPNLSGRSAWLAARRQAQPWPATACIGPFPELACTGLTASVMEELAIGSPATKDAVRALAGQLELLALADRRMDMLSGGESVRLALASAVAQGVVELHVDTALEQLDATWRARVLALLTAESSPIAAARIVADNHITSAECAAFGATVAMPGAAADRLVAIDAGHLAALLASSPRLPITLDGVTFGYTRRAGPVLRDLSLELAPGRLHTLSGANGAGKTTLVKLLSGTLLPTRGSIRFGSEAFRPGRSPRRFVGSAFQNPDFQWTTSRVAAQFRTLLPANRQRDAAALLEVFAVPPALADTHPNDLPFVFKKRLGIGYTLLDDKPWAIFDEPTLGQDETYAASLAASFEAALGTGRGLILISHDAAFRARFPAARHLLLRNGSVVDA
jgi:energy-coupling factor transporter ATP-binding protein EcfA2